MTLAKGSTREKKSMAVRRHGKVEGMRTELEGRGLHLCTGQGQLHKDHGLGEASGLNQGTPRSPQATEWRGLTLGWKGF